MRKSLLLAFCLTYAFLAFAKPVSEKQALEKALQVMPGKVFLLSNVDANSPQTGNGNVPYYVFNAKDNAGFVIVSGDDRTKAILGYSENGALDVSNLPENIAFWLGYYAEAISSLKESPENVEYHTTASTTKRDIEPLVKSCWGQSEPYNNLCVFGGTKCVTGCVATAMAQVVNYHKYPKTVTAIDGYTNGRTIPALSATTLDWANMCDTYFYNDTRTEAQKNAVATLMRYCGQSIEMNYGANSSSANTGSTSVALVKYFGYSKSVHAIYRDGYSEEGWENEIYQELAKKYPIIYSGRTVTNAGHAFVVDGYKDGLYHVNWGWGGACDGYFVLTVMDSNGDNISWTFSEDHSAIVGIRPTKGGTLDYPLMTVSQLELTSDREMTRVSSNDNFKVSVSYKIDNSVNSEDDLVGFGFALYKGDVMVQSLMQYSPSSQTPGWFYYGTGTLNFGSSLANGKYRIQAVYKDKDGNIYKAQGSDYRYVEADIKDNKLTLTNYPMIGMVTLSKSEAFIQVGKTLVLTATVSPSSLADKSVTWTSSDETVATVTAEGEVKGIKAGTATITCTSSTGLSATCTVTVGKVTLDRTKATVGKGGVLALTATLTPSSLDDKSVTWKSSDKSVAKVSTSGKVTGVKAGTATITCTSVATGWNATCKVTVIEASVTLDQTEVCMEKGKALTLKATVTPADLADKSVTWKTSDKSIATVSGSGKVKGVKYGTATITCTSNATGLSATCQVTVGRVSLSESKVSIRKGKTLTLTPTVYPSTLTDKRVTWESSDTKVATVSADGEVKGVKAGTATITCTSNAMGLSATCQVTVGYVTLDQTEASVKKGKSITLTATVNPSALEDKSVTWKSSNTKVATVSANGEVKGVKAGTAIITCTSNATGLSATCKVTVGYVILDQTVAIIKKGKTLMLTPTVYPSSLTGNNVTWKSSNAKVATVSADGEVKGIKAGTAIITCTSNATGLSASCKVTIGYVSLSESQATIQKGKTITLTPTVYPTSLEDKSVTWTSSNTKVATVTAAGKVKGIKAGTATITCTSNATGLSATCKVTVTASAGTRSLDGDDDDTTGIEEDMNEGATEPYDVYDLSGRMVRHQVTSLDGLPNGIYIVNGRKVLKKE